MEEEGVVVEVGVGLLQLGVVGGVVEFEEEKNESASPTFESDLNEI